jgi:hypothetical protein
MALLASLPSQLLVILGRKLDNPTLLRLSSTWSDLRSFVLAALMRPVRRRIFIRFESFSLIFYRQEEAAAHYFLMNDKGRLCWDRQQQLEHHIYTLSSLFHITGIYFNYASIGKARLSPSDRSLLPYVRSANAVALRLENGDIESVFGRH